MATHIRSTASRLRLRIVLVALVLAALAVVGAVVAGRASASAGSSGEFRSYPVPRQCQHRSCDYVANDRCEIEDPDYTLEGRQVDAYRMLVGYPEFQVNRQGQFHVASFEYLGYNELGEHHWDRVGVHVRIPGNKRDHSQRVTPIWWFLPGGVQAGKSLDGEDNGWTVRGLEVVFDAYDRGKHCRVVVTPWDVPWARR